MEERKLICNRCPAGCRITVRMEGKEILSVNGNACSRGEAFAKAECVKPMRILTGTVKIINGTQPVLTAVSEEAIPLEKMTEALAQIREISVSAPVAVNDVILENIAGTGVRLLASRSMDRADTEYLDVTDEAGIPSGRTVSRETAHREGILHRTAHVWIIRRNHARTEVLLQKRAMIKDSYPGCWDTSSAGHIPAGSAPKESALRELEEELGIKAKEDQLKEAGNFHIRFEETFHGKIFRDNEIAFLYVYEEPVDVNTLKLQASEVAETAWFDLDDAVSRVRNHDPEICVDKNSLVCLMAYLENNPLQE